MRIVHQALFAFLILWRTAVGEEEGYNDDGQGYNGNVAQQGQGQYNDFKLCSNSKIVVQQLSLLCDSPGTYYYGSGKYRNSEKCAAGDKGKLNVKFYLGQDLQNEAYLTIFVQGYGTVQGVFLHAFDPTCSVDTITRQDGGNTCADYLLQAGYYDITENFFFGSQDDNYEYTFRPKIEIGFSSDPSSNQYDLGGINSNKCTGSLFTGWTAKQSKSVSHGITSFLITFGILTLCICATAFVAWTVMNQAAAKSPATAVLAVPAGSDSPTSMDKKKQALLASNEDLVDT